MSETTSAAEGLEELLSLEEKIHAVEYEIYPEALRKLLKREVKYPETKST